MNAWLLVLALAAASALPAQPSDTAATRVVPVVPAAPAAPTAAAALPALDGVRVTGVHRLGLPGDTAPARAGIEDIIVVRVADVRSLVRRARCLDAEDRPVTPCEARDIALFLDGREIKGIVPESGAPRADEGTLQFHLRRAPDSGEAWADLLGAPSVRWLRYRPTEVSVGLSGDYALPTTVKNTGARPRFELVRAHTAWLAATLVGLAGLVGGLVHLARTTELVRDRTPAGVACTGPAPYSLARVQMAFWFVVVLAAWLVIWLTTDVWDTITPSVLALIGIGAGTAVGAAVIDANKQNAAARAAAPPPAPRVSNGFLNDVLSDANGYSFHRVQIFAWTLVLGVFFGHQVWARLAMPDLGPTLLGLMGISSGTYLGLKLPEQQR